MLKKFMLVAIPVSMFPVSAWPDINVGVIVSATGPASAMGAPQKHTT